MKLILSVVVMSWLVSAEAVTVAAKLKTLKLQSIDTKVELVKSTKTDKNTEILIGIPVKVILDNACTTFVGQQDGAIRFGVNRVRKTIQAMGSFDPMADACIEIAVEPVDATLTLAMSLPKEIPAGLAYFQDVVIGDKLVRVTFRPSTQQGSIRFH
jgi:hypothetical protein